MRRPNFRASLALACLLLLPAPARAATLTLHEYLAELERLSDALGSASPGEAESLSVALAPEWVVHLNEGERARVDARWLVQGLRDAPLAPDWTRARDGLRRRLAFHRAQATALADAPGGPTRASYRAAVAAVLAEEDLLRVSEPGLLERLQRRVGEWLQSLFRRIGVPAGGRRVAIIVAWTAGILSLAVFALWVATLLRAAPAPTAIRLQHRREVTSAREWGARWLAAVRRGELSDAVRCAYRAALSRLEEQGVWRIDESRTPREYRRVISGDDARAPAVWAIADAFERAIYGRQPLSAEDVRRVGEGLENLGCLQPGERAI